MRRILLYAIFAFPLFAFGENFKIKDGLYYSYWVFKGKGTLKEYGNLTNNPRKNG